MGGELAGCCGRAPWGTGLEPGKQRGAARCAVRGAVPAEGVRDGSWSKAEVRGLRQGHGGAWGGRLGGTGGSGGQRSVSAVGMREAAMASGERKEGRG